LDADQYAYVLGPKGPSISRTIGQGDPATVLCVEAERLQARTIVVGKRRVRGLSRVPGSAAGDVIKRAPHNVLVAHTVTE